MFKEKFLFDNEYVYCVFSLEYAYQSGSNEYKQLIIISKSVESTFLNYPHWPPDLALRFTFVNHV